MSVDPLSIAIPRTVPERPRRARRDKPVQRPRDEALFWIARQLLRATTDAERAAVLLPVADLVLVQKEYLLVEACEACQFSAGVGYITARVAVASAVRDANGLLPELMHKQAEIWRRGLVALVGRAAA